MILDSLKNSGRYVGCHPLFEKAFAFLKSVGDAGLVKNKIEIDGDSLFAIKVCDMGRGKAASPLETHRNYIDIQYAAVGEDLIGWRPVPLGTPGHGYNAEKDLELYDHKPDQWIIHPQGTLMIFFPEDGHAPMAAEGHVTKIVVKVKV